MIRRFKQLLTYNFLKTIYLNFRVLPFQIARKLPIKIGHHVDIKGIRKGCIRLKDGVNIQRYMVTIGIAPYPMISTKGIYTYLRFCDNGYIEFGDGVRIFNGVSIVIPQNGHISIGSDVMINQLTKIYANESVEIGNHCRFGWECQILDSDCHLVYNDNKKEIKRPLQKIVIGDNVWIASRSTVMKGVYIPPFSIVSGNSLVNKSFKDVQSKGNVFAGSPAKLIATGYYRLLNDTYEHKIKHFFIEHKEHEKIMVESDFSLNDYLYRG